jgi:hypothetical protein
VPRARAARRELTFARALRTAVEGAPATSERGVPPVPLP